MQGSYYKELHLDLATMTTEMLEGHGWRLYRSYVFAPAALARADQPSGGCLPRWSQAAGAGALFQMGVTPMNVRSAPVMWTVTDYCQALKRNDVRVDRKYQRNDRIWPEARAVLFDRDHPARIPDAETCYAPED